MDHIIHMSITQIIIYSIHRRTCRTTTIITDTIMDIISQLSRSLHTDILSIINQYRITITNSRITTTHRATTITTIRTATIMDTTETADIIVETVAVVNIQ